MLTEIFSETEAELSEIADNLFLGARELARFGYFVDAEKQLRQAIAIDTYCFQAYNLLEYVLEAQDRVGESHDIRVYWKLLQQEQRFFEAFIGQRG